MKETHQGYYLHYDSLNNLLAEMHNNIVLTVVKKVEHYKMPEDLEHIIYIIFEYWSSLPGYERKICKCATEYAIGVSFVQQMKKHPLSYSDDHMIKNSVEQKFLFSFVIGTIGTLYTEWLAHHSDVTLQEAVNATYHLISRGLDMAKL